MHEGQEGLILLNESPFYPEMGGQMGDTGELLGTHGQIFKVDNTISPYKGLIAHQGRLEKGEIKLNETVTAAIDRIRRQKIANNHTATHLLHWALYQVLGPHIKQAGSVVDESRLRFDFSHHKSLSMQEIKNIEDIINDKIRANLPVKSYELSYEEARKREDIKQFFGEKYGNIVRVVDIDYSKELCGGTHTPLVGNIGLFRIAKESSIAAGVRRIEAVTGKDAENIMRENEDLLNKVALTLKTQPQLLEERLEKLLEENKHLSQELKNIKIGQLGNLISTLTTQADRTGPIVTLIAEIPVDMEELRHCVDQSLDALKSGIVILATTIQGKCQVIAKVSDDLVKKGYAANDLIKFIAPIIEGSGGGKPNTAQAAGKAPQKLKEALEQVHSHIYSLQL